MRLDGLITGVAHLHIRVAEPGARALFIRDPDRKVVELHQLVEGGYDLEPASS